MIMNGDRNLSEVNIFMNWWLMDTKGKETKLAISSDNNVP